MWWTVVLHCAFSIFQISARQKLLSVAQHERISRLKIHICWFAFRFESTSCFYCVPSLPHPVSSPDPQHISNNWIIIQFDILNVDLSRWIKLCPRSTLWVHHYHQKLRRSPAAWDEELPSSSKHMKLTRLCNYTQFTVLTPQSKTPAAKLAARTDKPAAK